MGHMAARGHVALRPCADSVRIHTRHVLYSRTVATCCNSTRCCSVAYQSFVARCLQIALVLKEVTKAPPWASKSAKAKTAKTAKTAKSTAKADGFVLHF